MKSGIFFTLPKGMPEGPLKDSWLLKLANLIVQGRRVLQLDECADQETMGGHLTFENFMAVLDEDSVSYINIIEDDICLIFRTGKVAMKLSYVM